MKSAKVIVADDHTLVRAGIRSLLEQVKGIEVVAEATDGREALQKIQEHDPDIVLMDIAMPGLNGLDAAARAARDFPDVRVIILSMHTTEEYVLQALRAGAAGYLVKDAALAELGIAIASVLRGETYLSPAVSKHVIEKYVKRTQTRRDEVEDKNPRLSARQHLTSRQREILQLIAEGSTNKDIASTLRLSVKTVDSHRTQLMDKLNIHDVAGLVRYAVRIGLVTVDR